MNHKPIRPVNNPSNQTDGWQGSDLALVNINLREGKGAGIDFARNILKKYEVTSLFIYGQIKEARDIKDSALGYLGKHWSARMLLESVDVAHRLINGEDPGPVPPELELFKGR